VQLSNRKELLADKSDLQFIEAHIWYCDDRNYVNCKINKRRIKFHNLILGHSPTISLSVDHINRNPLDNRRFNLRITTSQIQMINQTPRRGTIQSGVSLCGNYYVTSWTENGVKRNRKFNLKKFGREVAKQMALDKRLEIELSLNHYRIALHNLPPIEHKAD